MSTTDRPVHDPSIETAVLGKEAVLFDERTGVVHHLNASACAIWMLLDGSPIEHVIAALSETTGLPAAKLRGDVVQAIRAFDDEGLLQR